MRTPHQRPWEKWVCPEKAVPNLDAESIATQTLDAIDDAINPACWTTVRNRGGMTKTRRVSVEIRHREVTMTMEGSALHSAKSQPDRGTVCPACGHPGMTILAQTERDLPDDTELAQRALQPCNVHLQHAAGDKPSDLSQSAAPESSPTHALPPTTISLPTRFLPNPSQLLP